MPSTISRITTHLFRSPIALLAAHPLLLKVHQEQLNILVPQLATAAAQAINGTLGHDNLWITCNSGVEDGVPDFVLSCAEDSRGNKLPIFIATPRPLSLVENGDYLMPRLKAIIQVLHDEANTERIFSIFAQAAISKAFAQLWTERTGIACEPDPYYSATYARCTRHTFRNRQFTVLGDTTYELRVAVEEDLEALTDLCYDFALTSPPFEMTRDQAFEEARTLIAQRKVWVHTINRPGAKEEIASLVAVTRESANVSAITKVYTNPGWRGKRCAERLVRHVTKTLLSKSNKESVVLYVSCNNPARKVYQRVGFTSLGGEALCDDSSNAGHWLELGFDQKQVKLGLW
ncbi:hypothetical protein D9756_005958 [Leucocoprinus leucothites]|uniref:N-acetyltransferase domain-containing protein n=1 Tax=Leucocoprinus leucothites TaxID=201217 RepID=A0A8H5D379_9AGAR|nr:hypothetical protein D9756_005958 [Leucoagaricus leucothites]